MTGTRAYLDWNAGAPLRPEARAALLAALEIAGNPSSVHAEGRAARTLTVRPQSRDEGSSPAGRQAAAPPLVGPLSASTRSTSN